MSEERYFRPRNWERFQDFRRARPEWIRNHLSLLNNQEYLQLSERSALVLHRIWLLTAAVSGPLPCDFRVVSRQINISCRAFKIAFEELKSNGFIELCDLDWKPYANHSRAPKASAQAPETETETETERKTPLRGSKESANGGSGAPRSKRRTGARLPADWDLTDDRVQAAVNAGLARGRIRTEANKFRDYWHAKSGKDATKLDWDATWRNWCRNALEYKPNGPGESDPDRPPSHDDHFKPYCP